MNKSKIFLIIFIVISMPAVVFMTNCQVPTSFDFRENKSDIEKIEIAIVTDEYITKDIYFPNTELLFIVKNVDDFLSDFSALRCWALYMNPLGVEVETKVIKVTYISGNYELIGCNGGSYYVNGKYLTEYGFHYFDETQFQNLIDRYSQ